MENASKTVYEKSLEFAMWTQSIIRHIMLNFTSLYGCVVK